ncbi:mannose-6-phosphate isomerase, class I [Lutibacter holmesii]|uniref:mannose-6-phosphate isomerase n=1 Tax=Lutibacter holmesii TaxID=1137985 RepID=A0ABW3WL40_9FLAO
MSKIGILEGKIQNYVWGGKSYISELLGFGKSNVPCAEYWLGAHVSAPSILKTSEGDLPLNSFLEKDSAKVLGDEINAKFGNLPFLFKVLDVNDMLSIQVHPTKSEAEKGFKFENENGIPLTAPYRNYKDNNHKPEIMVALSEFWLLHGFLPKNKLIDVLKNIPEFKHFLPVFEQDGYFGLYKLVMEQTVEESNNTLRSLVARLLPLYKAGKLDKSSADYWAAKAVTTSSENSNLDKGIFSIYFFNIVNVHKGAAVFQDAGVPHAYLEGQNIELMANSDNVLRGGLTPKHIDVPELLKHIVFEETNPNIMMGELQNDGIERIYKNPAPDFELSQIAISSKEKYNSIAKTAQILIVIDGEIIIVEGDTTLILNKGQAAFLEAESNYYITTTSSAIVYKATAP